nr:MAG TPA: hypothetical protein [Caudoviricetes sp.]
MPCDMEQAKTSRPRLFSAVLNSLNKTPFRRGTFRRRYNNVTRNAFVTSRDSHAPPCNCRYHGVKSPSFIHPNGGNNGRHLLTCHVSEALGVFRKACPASDQVRRVKSIQAGREALSHQAERSGGIRVA